MEPIGQMLLDPARSKRASTRSPNTNERAFDEVMRQIEAGTFTATEPDEEPESLCPLCAGHGFIRHEVPLSHPDFGKAFPCACMEPVIAARRLEQIFGGAEVPGELTSRSFASYGHLAGADQSARTQVEAWAASGAKSIYLWGDFGVGKTSLAYAAFRHRIEVQQCDALFRGAADLLESIRATYDREIGGATSSQMTEAVKRVTLLLLDDLGVEKPSEWVGERLYMLVNHRDLSGLATIFTSNYNLHDLAVRLGKEHGQRIGWRIAEMCEDNIVHVQGANLRDRKGAT